MSRRGSVLQGIEFKPMDFDDHYKALQLTQQDRQFQQQQKSQDEKDSNADKYRKLKMIEDATEASKYQSPGLKSNSEVSKMMLELKNEYASPEKMKLPPDQLYAELQQKLIPIAQGYNTYHDNLVEQDALANEAVKANPNLDLGKIKADLQSKVDEEFLTNNPDGTIGFNQYRFGTKSDALNEILKPENAWKYSKGTKSLTDFVKKEGKKSELFSKAPDKSQINYSVSVPDWAQIVDEKGNILEYDPVTGLIPNGKRPVLALKGTIQDYEEIDENGRKVTKKMVVVPQSTMNKILSNDEFEYAFEGDWQNHLRGIKKIKPDFNIDAAKESDAKRIYFSQWLADNGLTQPSVSAITHLQPHPRISVNTGSDKKKNDTQDFVQRYKDAVESNDADKAVEIARGLFAGNGKYEFIGMDINKKDMGAVLDYKDADGDVKREVFKLDDPNIYTRLAGVYQKITGSDSKLEKNIFEGKKNYSNTTSKNSESKPVTENKWDKYKRN